MLGLAIVITPSRADQLKSYPIQDEPERGAGFQHKMSLEKSGMLRIDDQRARSRETQSAANRGVSQCQPDHPVRRPNPNPGVSLDRAGALPAELPSARPWGAGTGAPLPGEDDGPQPGAGDASDRALQAARQDRGSRQPPS